MAQPDAVYRQAKAAELISTVSTPAKAAELSGLAEHEGVIYAANDSANPSEVWRFDTNYQSLGAVAVAIPNVDWEDLAQDRQSLYVVDCGNNTGNRKTRKLYSIPWRTLSRSNEIVDFDRQWSFEFADQKTHYAPYRHNSDCEAAAVVGSQLWVFSKDWQDNRSRLYKLDLNTTAFQHLSPVDEFDAEGLVTGADYNSAHKQLAVLGYNISGIGASAFLWVVPVVSSTVDWKSAQKFKIQPAQQWEGVKWIAPNKVLLSSEKSILGPARLSVFALPGLKANH